MCGIVGIYDNRSQNRVSRENLTQMTDTLVHRGPDGFGYWVNNDHTVGLGHRRLSIIDLTIAGKQPMSSQDGRWIITYNGEIYNSNELRKELMSGGIVFKGHSDTEVLLEAIAHWGIDKTLPRLIGMFAFAAWDSKNRRLHLVRDRMGIKPLYWTYSNGLMLFASELKALVEHPSFNKQIDNTVLPSLFRYSYIPAPYSIYKNVYKLIPGQHIVLAENSEPSFSNYWSLFDIAKKGVEKRRQIDAKQCTEELDSLLNDAVKLRMISDVPIGALLSGGIDSTTVAAIMQSQSTSPIKTFSIGFNDNEYNEAQHAKAIAEYLGTDHTELYVEPSHAQSVIPNIPHLYDEPFSDSSQIPTFLVSELTKRRVTVALSGDGGDELFAGYGRYKYAEEVWKQFSWMGSYGTAIMGGTLNKIPSRVWDNFFKLVPRKYRPSRAGERIHKLANALREKDPINIYERFTSHWEDVCLNTQSKGLDPRKESAALNFKDFLEYMQYVDSVTYLPEDILTKVDRASMAVSLEVRVPLIDHRVVEYAWSIPREFKVNNGTQKWILRQVLSKYIPTRYIDRPKMGFGIPIGDWLRGPLQEWAEDLLDKKKLQSDGIFDAEKVHSVWNDHLSCNRNWQYHLWDILMFQAWKEYWL